jgi:hypothetical protein
MPISETNGAPPDSDRRSMPRHLRDSEHEGVEHTSVAGVRAEDAAPPRVRGWALWLALVALAAGTAWWWLNG